MGNPYVNDQAARNEIAQALGKLLADSYTLYLKTHSFHWNVVGPDFVQLHKLFEEQYTGLADAVDEIAERIRALGAKAPGSYTEFGTLSSIKDEPGAPAAQEMIRQLLADNTAASRSAQAVVAAAEAHDDVSTADLATQRVTVHEKAAWMLQSLLQ
ncbi:MAG TPA: DNA starvation/stationary phase protection protein [Stellaceae bacterium]|jgi:starvation-inducible DNA-binding protein